MALFAEIFPILAFFLAYQVTGELYIATLTTMTATMLQIVVSLIQKQPVSIERWVNFSFSCILGGAVLFFNNANFIKWKPTIGYIILAITFSLASYRQHITLLEKSLGHVLLLPKKTWHQLNNAWIKFFCGMGILNVVVAQNTDTKTWVYFKLFGVVGLTILFIIAQVIYLFWFKKVQLNDDSK